MRFNIEYMDYYKISKDQYEEIYDVVRETLCGAHCYTGTICAIFEDGIEWVLYLSAIISHDDIIDIWWDFKTSDGCESYNNDFTFSKIRELWKNGASE